MTTREQIIQEIEQIPDSRLEELLNFVRSLKIKHHAAEDTLEEPKQLPSSRKAFLAYLESEEKWSGVYRRLADS